MSHSIRCALVVLPALVPAHLTAQSADAAVGLVRRPFDIAPGSLADALEKFSRQAGVQVAVGDARIGGFDSLGARGDFTAVEALSLLLRGTGYVATREGGDFVLTPSAGTGAMA